jgi:argininosuccinate lyase
MLGSCGIKPPQDSELIQKTLRQILDDIEKGQIEFETDAEDIHMNIEKILIERIGDVGKSYIPEEAEMIRLPLT